VEGVRFTIKIWGSAVFVLAKLSKEVCLGHKWNSDISRQNGHISGTGGRIDTRILPADAQINIGICWHYFQTHRTYSSWAMGIQSYGHSCWKRPFSVKMHDHVALIFVLILWHPHFFIQVYDLARICFRSGRAVDASCRGLRVITPLNPQSAFIASSYSAYIIKRIAAILLHEQRVPSNKNEFIFQPYWFYKIPSKIKE
jgi:hypothetical protein